MTYFAQGAVRQIPTTNPCVYAFVVTGHIDDDTAEAMAKFMNDVFDREDEVSMILDLSGFTGSDWDAMLDAEVLESRFRALKHVAKYAVIGAPESARKMIGFMDKLIPVDARAFDKQEEPDAWAFVGAQPISRAA